VKELLSGKNEHFATAVLPYRRGMHAGEFCEAESSVLYKASDHNGHRSVSMVVPARVNRKFCSPIHIRLAFEHYLTFLFIYLCHLGCSCTRSCRTDL
jgi:hypothetical protein